MSVTVSVIIPNYNHAKYLTKRVESVMQQTFASFEVILLDDCSTDNSKEVIADLLKKYPVIRFYPNEKNTGSPFAQWNKGASLAKGKYLWFAESDDFCEPTLLETLVEHIEKDDAVSIAYAQTTLVNETGETINNYNKNLKFIYKSDAWDTDFIIDGQQACKKWLVYSNPIPNASGALIRKKTFDAVGGGDETMRLNGDWFLYCKLLAKHKLAFCAEALNYFRVHEHTQRHRAIATADTYLELVRINTFLRENIEDIESQAKEALQRFAHWWASSLPRQIKTKVNRKKNQKLYSIFKKVKPGLYLLVIQMYGIIGSRFLLNKLGLLKSVKQIRNAMFPGKYYS